IFDFWMKKFLERHIPEGDAAADRRAESYSRETAIRVSAQTSRLATSVPPAFAIVLGGIPRNRLRFIKYDISLGASCVPLRCSLPLRKRCCDEERARGRDAQG